MPRGVDDIETVTVPEARSRCRLDRDTTLLLLFHEVSGSGTIMNLTELMDLTGQFQNTFCGGGLACIHVRENTDVSVEG